MKRKFLSNTIIGIVIAVVIIGLGVFVFIEFKNNKSQPTPVPVPTPTPTPIPTPVPPGPVHIDVWDANKTPNQMRDQGWDATDNQLLFALFSTYGSHDWGEVGDDPKVISLYQKSNEIRAWFTKYVDGIAKQLKLNPVSTATVIVNDRNDAGGCYIGPTIMNQLQQAGVGSQVVMGDIFVPGK